MSSDKLVDRLIRSAEDVGQLYPILEDAETHEILDGREREKADPNWRRKGLKFDGELSQREKTLLRLKIKHHSNWHRKDISRQEVLTEIAERTGWRGLKPFADFLNVNESTISRYLPQKYKDEIKSQAAKQRACNPQAKKINDAVQILAKTEKAVETAPYADEKKQEILQNLKTTRKSLSILREKISTEISHDDLVKQWLNDIEWKFSLWECQEERPEGFGDKTFHGNCSPTIIFAMLKKYSSLNDELIFDPLAGSGTFIDVAKALGYKSEQILARDIHPLRKDILYGDAENTELNDESVDFIFAHFPYWKLVGYSTHEDDLSNMDLNDFLLKSSKILEEMHRILRTNRFLIVMIGNLRKQGILDLEAEFSILGRRYFTLWDKVVKRIRTWQPETRGQRMGLAIARAKQHNHTVVNHDTLLVFRKD